LDKNRTKIGQKSTKIQRKMHKKSAKIADSWTSILNIVDFTIKHQSEIVKYHGK